MKHFRYFLSVFLLCFGCTPLLAQNFIRVSGRVTDALKAVPLPFASIAVANSNLGTVTNDEGAFQMNIPSANINEYLLFTYLGYQTRKIAITEMTGHEVSIGLQPKPLELSEVEILGLTPQEVIRRAVENIPSNYGKDSLILTAYIRVQKTANHKLAEYTEAIVEDLKDGYYLYRRNEMDDKFRRSNLPHLKKGRVISDTSLVNALEETGKDATCLSCNFKEDLVEFYPRTVLDEKEFSNYDFRMEEEVNPDGGKYYHIAFDQKANLNKSLWKGEILIESVGFAICKISMKPSLRAYPHYEKTKYRHSFSIMGTSGWIKEMPMGETQVTYSRKGEKYCLNTIRNDYLIIYTNPQTGIRFKTRYRNDVVVTDMTRDPEMIRNFRGDKTLGIGQRWDQIAGPPDPEFWAGFNYLPIEEKLRQELSEIQK